MLCRTTGVKYATMTRLGFARKIAVKELSGKRNCKNQKINLSQSEKGLEPYLRKKSVPAGVVLVPTAIQYSVFSLNLSENSVPRAADAVCISSAITGRGNTSIMCFPVICTASRPNADAN